MYSWSYFLKSLMQYHVVVGQQLRSSFVFFVLYLIMWLPQLKTGTITLPLLDQLLILQGICLITIVMQVTPCCSSDVHDGFLENWLANQGTGFCYYVVRQLSILLEIILPLVILTYLVMPGTPLTGTLIFLSIVLINGVVAALWSGITALLLTGSHEVTHSIVGMLLAILLLIPQLLIGEVILTGVTTNVIASSDLWLYGGISLVSIAFNFGLVPAAIRLAVNS